MGVGLRLLPVTLKEVSMFRINRIVSQLGLLSILIAAPLMAVNDINMMLKDLTTSRKVGQDNALFFIKAFSQDFPEAPGSANKRLMTLNAIYKNAYGLLGHPMNQNGIWLNQQGRVLYRVPKGKLCSCLYLYNMATKKHVEIAKFHNVKHESLPPYRLNNKNEIFYFDHSSREGWIGKIQDSVGHEKIALDTKLFDSLENPWKISYEEFLGHFCGEMLRGGTRVDYNDLGQVLFSSGKVSHQTWLIDPKHSRTLLWDHPYRVLGLNRSGDIFLHSALSKGAVYHTSNQKLFVFDTKHTSHEGVILNRLRSAIFPADPFADPLLGAPQLYLAGDLSREIDSFEGHKLFFQHMNDRASAVGFGAISLLSPHFKLGYTKGVVFNVTEGVRELQDFDDRRSASLGINSAGTIVGFAEDPSGKLQAFMKSSEGLAYIGAQFPGSSMALDINDQEWVLGIYKDAQGLFQGFLYHPKKGAFNIAHGLHEHEAGSFNIPIGFNENGQVVGVLYYLKDNGLYRTAFVCDPDRGHADHLPHYPHERVKL